MVPVLQPLGPPGVPRLPQGDRAHLPLYGDGGVACAAPALLSAPHPPADGGDRLLLAPVVGLTAIFTGMVLALQSYTGFTRFNAERDPERRRHLHRARAGAGAGLMVAGRIGAAIAAEIGTMRVTEQIDALTTLSTNPFKYLIAPRLIAGLLMLPCLVLVADIIGVFGGIWSRR